jgi:hypothetical protein
MKYAACLLCVGAALLLPFPAMPICQIPQPRLVCAEYFASQLVVEATLVQTRELHEKDDTEYISAYVHTLRVNRTLSGQPAGTIRVYEGNDSGRAGFNWIRGKAYLFFYPVRQEATYGNSTAAATRGLLRKRPQRFPKSPPSKRRAATVSFTEW